MKKSFNEKIKNLVGMILGWVFLCIPLIGGYTYFKALMLSLGGLRLDRMGIYILAILAALLNTFIQPVIIFMFWKNIHIYFLYCAAAYSGIELIRDTCKVKF